MAAASSTPEIGVFLTFQNKPSASFQRQMRREVDSLLAPAGLRLRWVDKASDQPAQFLDTVWVELRGACRLNWSGQSGRRVSGQVVLGWTLVHEGRVQPESMVDCDQISGVIAALARDVHNPAMLHRMHTRLAGRVMAHELMHALLRTPVHHFGYGEDRPLRPWDLLEPGHLEQHQIVALRQVLARRSEPVLAQDPKPGAVLTP